MEIAMNRTSALVLLLASCLAVPVFLYAEDAQKKDDGQPAAQSATATAEEKLKQNPDDAEALRTFLGSEFSKLTMLIRTQPDQAEKQLKSLQTLVDSLQPEKDDAKQILQQAKFVITYLGQQLELARVSVEELQQKLQDNADDAQSINRYATKLQQEIALLANSDPDKAEQQLAAAQDVLKSVKERAKEDSTKRAVEQASASLARIESSIERAKKLAKLVGQDAAPLEVEAWVNGAPLTDADLKAKVVLLDFWAVWCGPCIATFPHLREWQEKYADKGLVIIGLTNYYNYKWDNEAERAKRAEGEVAPDEEQKMLERFAEHHDLHHRFAIQKGDKLSEYYAVSGIPHVVVIDQEGKVRLVRVGSGDANARDISELLDELLSGEPQTSAGAGE
jgi:thiol-disulfide isomerase/thioredoxin